jgi:broad specificity phosphatase PhoE
MQTVWLVRHGDRADHADKTWRRRHAERADAEDAPLSELGHAQAAATARWLLGQEQAAGRRVAAIISSPFCRCVQTAAPLSVALGGLPIMLEHSVGETGCRRPPPPPPPTPPMLPTPPTPPAHNHQQRHRGGGADGGAAAIAIDPAYTPLFVPRCAERPAECRPRMLRAVEGLIGRFGGSGDGGDGGGGGGGGSGEGSGEGGGGSSIVIVSHLDPIVFMAAAFAGLDDAALVAPVAPCGVFQLRRRRAHTAVAAAAAAATATVVAEASAAGPFELVLNGGIEHLVGLGATEPGHPVHKHHDWTCLWHEVVRRAAGEKQQQQQQQQQQQSAVPPRWPPPAQGDLLPALKRAWHARYTVQLLREGRSAHFPVIGALVRKRKKRKFPCPACGVECFVKEALLRSAPPSHSIRCWRCEGVLTLADVADAATSCTGASDR